MKVSSGKVVVVLALALALSALATPQVRAQEGGGGGGGGGGGQSAAVRAGYLTCHVSSGWGFIFGSSRDMHCSYAMQPGYTEFYTGSISKFGADIGYLSSAVMIWAVLAPTTNLGQGALAGTYAGA